MSFEALWSSTISIIKTISIFDVIDVIIVSFLIYEVILIFRRTRASQLIKGILFLLVSNFVATQLGLRTFGFLLGNVLQFGVFALIVVFQPEMRRALEQVGRTDILSFAFMRRQNMDDELRANWQDAIVAICDGVEQLAERNIGALICIERKTGLSDIVKTGTPLNADLSAEIIKTVFYQGTALHDGAMVVSDARVRAAGCLLPLSHNLALSKDMGTRHRAALGLSEVTDAIVVVVSEETGTLSLAKSGVLIRRLDRQSLFGMLVSDLVPPVVEQPDKKQPFWRAWFEKH